MRVALHAGKGESVTDYDPMRGIPIPRQLTTQAELNRIILKVNAIKELIRERKRNAQTA